MPQWGMCVSISLLLASALFNQGQVLEKPKSISAENYLLNNVFEGVYIGEIRKAMGLSKVARSKEYPCRLKFWQAKNEGNGTYTLSLGNYNVSGEWNVMEWNEAVNLWLDKVNQVQTVGVPTLVFRLPRYDDDFWVATEPWKDEFNAFPGNLIMRKRTQGSVTAGFGSTARIVVEPRVRRTEKK